MDTFYFNTLVILYDIWDMADEGSSVISQWRLKWFIISITHLLSFILILFILLY